MSLLLGRIVVGPDHVAVARLVDSIDIGCLHSKGSARTSPAVPERNP